MGDNAVAALIARRHSTMLWAPQPETAAEIDGSHTNVGYLPGFTLPEQLMATDDLEKAMRRAELLIVGVPTTAMRATLHIAKEWIHPWIPVVSLSKGLEQGSLLRMTEVVADEIPGHPVAALTGPNIAREIMAGQGGGERHRHRRSQGGPGHPVRADPRRVPDLHQPRRDRL